ncbi:uncharacterized protein LOC131327323 [Rhododendron vialii]|uniref:uncharacterized protein LOC131327323 n=1 Tax=Rhododendron vialii TaxID=182163 RepID=UPI00265FF6A6|nr:uncharacterized protein LOC131327323 [Rhododendron vialii]
MDDRLRREGNGLVPKYFNPNFFSIKVHHGGNLTVEGGRNYYVGGRISYSDYEERDKVSFFDLNEIGRKLGINDEVKIYCKVPSSHFDGDFKLMRTDNDVLKMVRQIKDNVVEIFLVISNSIVDDLLDVNVGNWEWDCGTFPESGITIENIDTIEGLSGTLVEVEDDSDSDKNYDEFNDSDYELSDEDDRLYEDNVDDNTKWAGTLFSNTRVPSQTLYYNTVEGEDMVYEDEGDSTDSDDGFRSWDEEDGDNSLNKALVFKAIKGREEPIFGNGMIFRSRHQLAEAIRQHSILNGKEIRFLKNETTRVRAKCKTYEKDEEKIDCPWELSATDKGVANKTLQVKKYNPNHNCGRIWNNRLMNSNWLARIYFDDIRITPTMKPLDIQEKVRHDFQCDVSESQCYRVRGKVLRKIQGTIEDQYARLWDYCNEIMRSNPDTSVYIRLKPDQDGIATNVFQRFYICWAALKKGFREGCRPIIGVDGTHLKGGHCLGQLLTAVGVDANDQTFPVAYAIVEQENTHTWTWFLQHLIPDLQILNQPTWTIISDKQKGLENAIKELLPSIEHRHCVRHLHNNFKSAGFPGQDLHDKMWNLARASYVGKFTFLMEELKKEYPRAFTWLSHQDRNPCHWSRSHFIVTPKCDILLNNLCEPFNKAILCARDKPILTMLERLRTYFMKRLVEKREFATKWVDHLGPKIHKKIEKLKKMYGDFNIYPCGNGEFEARWIHGGQHTVNLEQRTCSCRRWDLTGIPCQHATAVIGQSGLQPEDYVSEWYHKHTFEATYQHIMHPLNGPDMWEKSGKDPILPAEFTKQPGRPKKSRRREPDEPPKNPIKLSKRGVKMSCRRCGKEGHNTRTCKAPVDATPVQYTSTRGRGRGRALVDATSDDNANITSIGAQ